MWWWYVGSYCPLVATAGVSERQRLDLDGAFHWEPVRVPFIFVFSIPLPPSLPQNFPGTLGLPSHEQGKFNSANIYSAGIEWPPTLCPVLRLVLELQS